MKNANIQHSKIWNVSLLAKSWNECNITQKLYLLVGTKQPKQKLACKTKIPCIGWDSWKKTIVRVKEGDGRFRKRRKNIYLTHIRWLIKQTTLQYQCKDIQMNPWVNLPKKMFFYQFLALVVVLPVLPHSKFLFMTQNNQLNDLHMTFHVFHAYKTFNLHCTVFVVWVTIFVVFGVFVTAVNYLLSSLQFHYFPYIFYVLIWSWIYYKLLVCLFRVFKLSELN